MSSQSTGPVNTGAEKTKALLLGGLGGGPSSTHVGGRSFAGSSFLRGDESGPSEVEEIRQEQTPYETVSDSYDGNFEQAQE